MKRHPLADALAAALAQSATQIPRSAFAKAGEPKSKPVERDAG
jgi:hypothetical protein